MSLEEHVLLLIEYRDGQPLREPVHAAALRDGLFSLRCSPGLVQGIAAGDEFRLLDADGAFEVTCRSGNLAIQVFSRQPVQDCKTELEQQVKRLGGVLDGGIERGLVFTLPVSVGFPVIEDCFNRWVDEHPGWEWYFGNVYDPRDGITSLNWWQPR